MRGVDLGGLFLRDLLRERDAGIGETCVRHVTDGVRLVGGLRELEQRIFHLARRRHVGVAEAEVVDLVLAVFLLQFDPGLEHPANPGRMLHVAEDFRGDYAVHHLAPSLFASSSTVS